MMTVWKFDIPINDAFTITMPQGAKVLDVQVQYGEPRMWALVDPESPTEPRRFVIAGTGHQMPDSARFLKHVGTFQLEGGSLVFHLFDASEVPEVKP